MKRDGANELRREIEQLKRRVEQLEARPAVWVYPPAIYPQPWYPAHPWQPYYPPVITWTTGARTIPISVASGAITSTFVGGAR